MSVPNTTHPAAADMIAFHGNFLPRADLSRLKADSPITIPVLLTLFRHPLEVYDCTKTINKLVTAREHFAAPRELQDAIEVHNLYDPVSHQETVTLWSIQVSREPKNKLGAMMRGIDIDWTHLDDERLESITIRLAMHYLEQQLFS